MKRTSISKTLGLYWLSLLVGSLALLAQPFAYVGNSNSDDVTVIDTATDTVVATIPVDVSRFLWRFDSGVGLPAMIR